MGSEDRAASPIHRRFIADAAAMHRRRRGGIGAIGVEKVGLHIEPHRRCIGDAVRSSDPIYSDPIQEA
eukprot:2601544-Pyramimonas_sp.AAC.1